MDIGSFINSTCGCISDGILNDIFTNPIYVSFLVTVCVLLIIIVLYNGQNTVKTGVYVFMSSLFLIFVHNKMLLIEHRRRLSDGESDKICDQIGENLVVNKETVGGVDSLGYLTL